MKHGYYELIFYCDEDWHRKVRSDQITNHETFTSKTREGAITQARRAGWLVGKKDYCPTCRKIKGK